MFSINKISRVIYNIMIFGLLVVLLLSKMSFPLKIVLFISGVIILEVISFLSTFMHCKKIIDKYLFNCEIEKYKSIAEKHLKKNVNSIVTCWLKGNLILCYAFLNDKKLLNEASEEFVKETNNLKIKIDNLVSLANVYNIIGDYESVSKIKDAIYNILRAENIDKYIKDKEAVIKKYDGLSKIVDANNDTKNKDKQKVVEDIFKRKLDQSKYVLQKVGCNYQLILIYERMENKEKAEECAKYVLENHKDFYLDPTIMDKYKHD